MKTETKQPLYKVLNDGRQRGPWEKEYQQYENDGSHICLIDDQGSWIADFGNEGQSISETSAQYTALAVNNLHLLAEALQNFITDEEISGWGYNPDHIRQAKKALSAIS